MKHFTKKDFSRLLFVAVIFACGWILRHVFHGVKFLGNLALCMGLYFLILTMVSHFSTSKICMGIRKAMLILFALGLTYTAALEVYVLSYPRAESDAKPDVVLILGAATHGYNPSYSLKSRLDAAVTYLQDHPDVPIICCGGVGSGEQISEAESMRFYLVEHGIDGSCIYKDETSTTTKENIENAKKIIENTLGLQEVTPAIVTSDYHLQRARLYWGSDIIPVAATLPLDRFLYTLTYYIREAFGLTQLFLTKG